MKASEIKRFADREVVGQRLDGLFFEARVEDRNGEPRVVESDGRGREIISPANIKWLVASHRYC
jgi:hypothetical protein